MNTENLSKNLLLFHQYLRKNIVLDKLKNNMNRFPEFSKIYSKIKPKGSQMESSEAVVKTLVYGIKENLMSTSDLDELLFLILEDSLFNSFLFKLKGTSEIIDVDINTLLKNWNIPAVNKILNNVQTKSSSKQFVICGYRKGLDGSKLESLRLLLLDSEILTYANKNEDPKKTIYPTIVEFDFRRQLLHIRLRDVDNIVNAPETRGTMSGRIENTLNFISSFKPELNFSKITNFKSSLYRLEEHLLSEKRDSAYVKLEEFNKEIDIFTETVCNKFNPPSNLAITPKDYISTGVLCIVATTLQANELGDVIGIRFRDTEKKDDNERKDGNYAEITIKDSGDKCISTSNLYWLNLSVLQNAKEVEFLKIVTQVPSEGVAVANLEFSLDTANIRLLQRNKQEGAKPTQEKYDDVLDFINKFIN